MIDIHNHIIPAIDDGPDTLEQSLELLRIAEANDIERMVCTPHMHPGRYDNDINTIAPAFDVLVGHVQQAGIGVQLAMGAEVRFGEVDADQSGSADLFAFWWLMDFFLNHKGTKTQRKNHFFRALLLPVFCSSL